MNPNNYKSKSAILRKSDKKWLDICKILACDGSILACMMSFMLLQPDFVGLYLPVIGGLKNIFAGIILIVGLIVYQGRSGNQMIDHEVHFYIALGGILGTFILFHFPVKF